MNRDLILDRIRKAITGITAPRFYETERGYQGALVAELTKALPEWTTPNAIVEQEYQKRVGAHGIRIRPDIVIHEPFNEAIHNSRIEGNVVAFELKLNATADAAAQDFMSLREMVVALRYPLCVFININSSNPHVDSAPLELKGHLVAFAVRLETGIPHVVEQRT